jgi:hypothetical protein
MEISEREIFRLVNSQYNKEMPIINNLPTNLIV